MRILRGALALALAWPGAARAAEITHVASAATEEWPAEFDVSAGFEGQQEQADIAKEQFQSSQLIHGTELHYTRSTEVLPLRLAVGLWHELELHLVVPLVISDDQHWDYAGVSNNGALDTVNKPAGICPEGPLQNGVTTCGSGILPNSSANTLVPQALPVDSNRGGFAVGNIQLGVAWAAISERQDPSLPTWVLGFDYSAPTASAMNPTKVSYLTSGNSTIGDVGDGLHHFHPYSALSKRQGAFDPYVKVWADFAHATGATYDNCDNPYPHSNGDPRLNCGVGVFTTAVTRLQPETQGGFEFGSEFVAYDNPAHYLKFAVDLRAVAEYHSTARTYTQLSDLLQELTEQQDYARLGGQIGIHFRAAKYFNLTASFALLHDTDHWLTQESLGGPSTSGAVQVGSAGQNPNYDFRFDNPGSRFLLQNSLIGHLSIGAMALF